MPQWWVGDSTGVRRQVVDPWVGDSTGVRRKVEKAWVGDQAGVPRLFFQRTPPVTVGLAATPVSSSQIRLDWTGAGADSYRLHRGGTLIFNGGGGTFTDSGLPAGTAFAYRIDAMLAGAVAASSTASASTLPVQYENRFVSLRAVSSASFNGSGTNRNVPDTFYGQFSSVHGNQRSLWCFDIPADVRNCVSIDRVDLAVFNQHHFNAGGNNVSLVAHHGAFQGGFPAQFPGSTGELLFNGALWRPFAARSAWLNAGANDGGWMTNCQLLAAAGRATLAEEFRTGNAQGLGLLAPSTAQAHYGYGQGATQANVPQIRFWYTVRVG
jgi:hypothetical protein